VVFLSFECVSSNTSVAFEGDHGLDILGDINHIGLVTSFSLEKDPAAIPLNLAVNSLPLNYYSKEKP
jgi:hypothetical protein